MDGYDYINFVLINDTYIQVILWAGTDIPDSLVPLDGRIINGIKLPDHRNNYTCVKNPITNDLIIVIRECVLLKDLEV